MIDCPKCKKVMASPTKSWKYGVFVAQAYLCNNCGTKFNEYLRNGKHSFTLQLLGKGKGYKKVR